jgi:hypothetical protein
MKLRITATYIDNGEPYMEWVELYELEKTLIEMRDDDNISLKDLSITTEE